MPRPTEACLVLAFVLAAGSVSANAQAASSGEQHPLSPNQITEWEGDGVSAGLRLIHVLFPEINPDSKSIILNNRNWRASSTGTGWFTIYVCEPDLPSRNAELQRDFFTRHDIQCSVVTVRATFLMSGSQLGPVPAEIMIERPTVEKQWSDLAALLLAHPEWSRAQVEDAMKASGVKYGVSSHNEFLLTLVDSLKKLEPFLGKLTIDSMRYFPPDLTDKRQPQPPIWRVEVQPSGQDKTKPWARYVLIFNVFDGAFEGEQIFTELGSSESPKPR